MIPQRVLHKIVPQFFTAINSSAMHTDWLFSYLKHYPHFLSHCLIPSFLFPGATSKANLLNPSPYLRFAFRGNPYLNGQCHCLYLLSILSGNQLLFYYDLQISQLFPSPVPLS